MMHAPSVRSLCSRAGAPCLAGSAVLRFGLAALLRLGLAAVLRLGLATVLAGGVAALSGCGPEMYHLPPDAGTADRGGRDFSGDTSGTDSVLGGEDGAVQADGCNYHVKPEADPERTQIAVQTALILVPKGGRVCFAAGTYHIPYELSLTVPNVELRGPDASQGEAVLDFTGQKLGGNGLTVTADGFTMRRLTVKNTPGDGIRVTGVSRVTFSEVTVTWDAGPMTSNGAYGIYPVQCSQVLIEKCKVSYAADAGIYVGQSNQVIVRQNEVYGNVAGIEFENTVDGEAHDNDVHDNTGGILVFNLPNLPMQGGTRTRVHHNHIHDNNQENFAEIGSIVSLVPAGAGTFVLSSDNNEFHDNVIEGNHSVGLAVVSFFITMRQWDDMRYDPYPEGNYIHDNTFMNNGTMPTGLAQAIAFGLGVTKVEDMVWDGIVDPNKTATGNSLTNCFKNNGSATFRNLDAGSEPNPFMNTSTDVTPFTCEHDPLPPLSF